jgi:hypothetical protein
VASPPDSAEQSLLFSSSALLAALLPGLIDQLQLPVDVSATGVISGNKTVFWICNVFLNFLLVD